MQADRFEFELVVIPAKAGTQFAGLSMRERYPAVYIVASKQNGTLYTGVTSDLPGRIWQHRSGTFKGFSRRYGCKILVWFEMHETMESAIIREKRIKEWQRAWKLRLIEEQNSNWDDLYESLF